MGEPDPVFPSAQLNPEVRARIAERRRRSAVLAVIGLPKSATSNFTTAASELLRSPGTGAAAKADEFDAQGDLFRATPISTALLSDPRLVGGWQTHAAPSNVAVELLRLHAIPCIILARHPFDHLVALAYHWRKPPLAAILDRYAAAGRTHVNTAISSVAIAALRADQPIGDSVLGLIAGGHLFHALRWLAGWLDGQHLLRSLLLRTEELNRDPAAAFGRVADLVGTPGDSRSEAIERATSRFDARRRQKIAARTDGDLPWTGHYGAWTEPQLRAAAASYDAKVAQVMALAPEFAGLARAFPDLLCRT